MAGDQSGLSHRGPVHNYQISRPAEGASERTHTVFCRHCGRRIQVTILGPSSLRRLRWTYAAVVGVSVAGAGLVSVILYLLSLLPQAAFVVGISLIAFPGGVAVLAGVALAFGVFAEKGIALEDDRPDGVPPGAVELAPDQQFHRLA